MDYDPEVVTYEELLDVFWGSGAPFGSPWSRQYMAAVFYHNEEQKRLALERRDREAGRGKTVHVEIMAAPKFYRAEDYHQKYYLRRRPELFKILRAHFPSEESLIDSGTAARLNGYLAGYRKADIEEQLSSMGLSTEEVNRIMGSIAAPVY